MDRRRFLQCSLAGCGAMALPAGMATAAPQEKARSSKRIHPQYIRERTPSFEIPPYRGHSYEDRVPDTLDVAERARIAINGVTAISDPATDYEIRWFADFVRNPPVLWHDFSDWVQNQEGLMEVLPLLRMATGDGHNSDVDPVWMKSLLKSIGPDGLVYLPLNGRPWSRLNAQGVDPVWRADGSKTNFKDSSVTQAGSAATSERAIGTMTVYYLRDKNPMWRKEIEKMIDRLQALAIDRGDYCYFAPGSFEPNAKIDPNAPMQLGSLWGTTWNSRLIQALAQYYRVSGYEPARTLAGKLTAYTRYHGQIFEPGGAWLMDPEIKADKKFMGKYNVAGLNLGGHGHGHGIALISVLEYALAINDHDLLEFCNRSFRWATKSGDTYGVSSLVGWFPEWYVPGYPYCESCTVGDFLGMAVKLSEAGAGDYWDEIDRWMRNHFAEAQMTSPGWLYKMAETQPRKPVAWNETSYRVPERSVGAWAGWAGVNEWVGQLGIQHCCTGNAPRGLFYVWQHMVDYQGGQLRVNLLMNRASRWADVYSHIPYTGRVDVKMKHAGRRLRVRAPEWVNSGSPELVCKVNGTMRKLGWEGRYVEVGAVKPGDKIGLTFPISERTVKEKIGPGTYTLVVKGSTVLSMDPAGTKNGPLYLDREKYRKQPAAWKMVRRSVPEQEIYW